VKIVTASDEDIDEIIAMGESFFYESGYNDVSEYSPERTLELVEKLINEGTLLVCKSNEEIIGMLGFMIAPIYMSVDTFVGQELFWYVKKENRKSRAGILLLLEMEKASKEKGAKLAIMVCLDRLASLDNLYNKMGYSKIETSFMRVL